MGVEFKMKGTMYRAYGSTVVLAAGGIGSPCILRATGIKTWGMISSILSLPFAESTSISPRKRNAHAVRLCLPDDEYHDRHGSPVAP